MPNSKVLESKKAIVDALATKLQGSTAAVFVDYKGITVAQDTELRNKFREAGVEYTVVKNTLTRFAANKAGYNQFDEMLNGTTSLRRASQQGRSHRPGSRHLPGSDLRSGILPRPDPPAEGRPRSRGRSSRRSLIHHSSITLIRRIL